MPLTQRVTFQTVLEKGNRIQIPKIIQDQFKMTPSQVIQVSVTTKGYFTWQTFYAKTDKQGRITIPKLTLTILSQNRNPNLAGNLVQITLQPA